MSLWLLLIGFRQIGYKIYRIIYRTIKFLRLMQDSPIRHSVENYSPIFVVLLCRSRFCLNQIHLLTKPTQTACSNIKTVPEIF